jgi:hypothetical protein
LQELRKKRKRKSASNKFSFFNLYITSKTSHNMVIKMESKTERNPITNSFILEEEEEKKEEL